MLPQCRMPILPVNLTHDSTNTTMIQQIPLSAPSALATPSVRIELILCRLNIPYDRVVYGYGQGAGADRKGYDESGGPVALTGKKMLPVLEMGGRKYSER